jgi:SAM-dependent methyltransferase
MTEDQQKYGNNWERTVLGSKEPIDPDIYAREIARYKFAAQYIKPGDRVLELGCSSGFGIRFLPEDIRYTGVDYSHEIIKYAKSNFASSRRKFVWSTIDKFFEQANGQRWDVIIAFEVLEHVKNGREIAQKLKTYAKKVILTTPYREPPGFWGPHHLLHWLREADFAQFEYRYMHMNGAIESFPTTEIANLMVMVWEQGKTYKDRKRVLCCIPTAYRYDSLMFALQSVMMQTVKPDKVHIYDDGDHDDLRKHAVGRYMLPLLTQKGIEWEVIFTDKEGQHRAHELSNIAGYDFVWRMDDDCVAEPDVLERLLAHMADDVGAVGGAVYQPDRIVTGGTSKIQDFFDGGNIQWAPNQGMREVDFLYCSFLYRAGIVHYKTDMSRVAYHEETIFTHRMKRAGYKLIADTSIVTYHLKNPDGGTRQADNKWAYAYDHKEFMRLMAEEFRVRLIHLGTGMGDVLAFKNILPDLRNHYDLLVIGTVFPQVFEDEEKVHLIPYEKALGFSDENVYNWMADRKWTGHIIDAYREMYLGFDRSIRETFADNGDAESKGLPVLAAVGQGT